MCSVVGTSYLFSAVNKAADGSNICNVQSFIKLHMQHLVLVSVDHSSIQFLIMTRYLLVSKVGT